MTANELSNSLKHNRIHFCEIGWAKTEFNSICWQTINSKTFKLKSFIFHDKKFVQFKETFEEILRGGCSLPEYWHVNYQNFFHLAFFSRPQGSRLLNIWMLFILFVFLRNRTSPSFKQIFLVWTLTWVSFFFVSNNGKDVDGSKIILP